MLYLRLLFIFAFAYCLGDDPNTEGPNDRNSPLAAILRKRQKSKYSVKKSSTLLSAEIPTVTVTSTLDFYRTSTITFYNSVPVTITEVIKSTLTLPTFLVLRTPVDDEFKVETISVIKTKTETVTDVLVKHSIYTNVSTKIYSVTHLNKNILQTTVISTFIGSHTFQPTIVQTVISTKKKIITETVLLTNTIWVDTNEQ